MLLEHFAHQLESFRIHAAGRPLLLVAGVAAIAWVALRPLAGRGVDRGVARLVASLAVAALGVYAAIASWYASIPAYFDPAEATMPIVGWLFTLGQPLYHDTAAAERYAHVYGPVAFIAHGAALRAAGPSIEASKWVGAAAGIGSLACSYAALATATTRSRALVLTGGCALVYLLFRNITFWTRPDALLLLVVAAGLAASVRFRAVAAALAVGVAAGLLAGLKMTGPLYAVPLVALLANRHGWRLASLAVAAAIGVTALPFLWPNVSAAGYLSWMRLSAGTGLVLATLRQNIEWAGFLLLPIAVAWFGSRPAPEPTRAWQRLAGAIAIGLAGVAMAASKPGAGFYHLLPFVPAIAYVVATTIGDRRPLAGDPLAAPLAAAWTLVAVAIAIAQQQSFVRVVIDDGATAARADLRAYVDAHPRAVVQMAYSGVDRPTFVRPDLTFRSGVYLLDAPAVQEHQLAGVAVPAATIDAIRACRIDAWLAPRDADPFAGPSRYLAMAQAPLFPDAFRTAFREAYVKDGATRFFDVWRCRRRGAR